VGFKLSLKIAKVSVVYAEF